MKLVCVDLFCGAGGASTGLIEAAAELDLEVELIAINHWPVAIATHSANYPWARHICARIDQVRPRDLVPGGRVHLMVAGPECTHHSVARGGWPVDDQKRVPAWGILPWLADLYVDHVVIENVPEFRGWGPLGANGKPLKSRTGETYQAFLQAIRAHGYTVDEAILCCADYGDATTRKRLFIQATRRGLPTFPPATHSPEPQGTLFTQPWRPARTIIDWSLMGESIFARKKPLVAKTLRRIAAGMLRFNGIDITQPLSQYAAEALKTGPKDPACVARFHAIEGVPFMVASGGPEGKGRHPKSVEQPLRTILTENHEALIRPFLVMVNHGDPKSAVGKSANGDPEAVKTASARCHSLEMPFPTVTCKNGYGIVSPQVTTYCDRPVAAGPLVEPAAGQAIGGRHQAENVPLLALGNGLFLDIRFRMLRWHELAAAQGFPKGYVFNGNQSTKVKQIGNAVPRSSAKALCLERLKGYARVLPSGPHR